MLYLPFIGICWGESAGARTPTTPAAPTCPTPPPPLALLARRLWPTFGQQLVK